jgi:hypothetical protein
MKNGEPASGLPLEVQLAHWRQSTRDLIEHMHSSLLPLLHEFRRLSRSKRKRSPYPTRVALGKGLRKLCRSANGALAKAGQLADGLAATCQRAQKEAGSP